MKRLVSLLLLLPGLALAQQPAVQPISVVADRLEMSSETGRSTYEGNVEMRQGDMLLRADSLQLLSTGTALQVAIARGNSGEVVGLLGPNGAGKTTCFYMIVGLVPCDQGSILLDGTT
jgi:ABC-type multidrug transport system ATPase subunit